MGKCDRETAIARIETYFEAMDRGDVAATVACFTEDASLISETNKMRCDGYNELQVFFDRITANTDEMKHITTAIMFDETKCKGAAELRYTNRRKTGADIDTAVCNVFDFAPDGRFARVRFWTADVVTPASHVAVPG